MDVKRPRVEVDIGALVIHGLPPGAGREIGEGVRAELARLLDAGGVPPGLRGGHAAPRLTATYAPGADPAATAASIARAVYGALGGGR